MIAGKRIPDLVAELSVREHRLISGVLQKLGGGDEGPDPHELLEAALAACTIITVQMYANRKGWSLESTDVTVKVTSESKESSHLEREVRFRGELTEEQRQRLMEIANKCPIHRLLESQITVTTRMSTEPPESP